ncbi:MAG: hypothetical protein ACPG5J_10375 [Pseudomonadales bacterium]
MFAIAVLVVLALGYWFLKPPAEPMNVVQKIEPQPVEKVRTRVEATMTNCARRGDTTRVEGLVHNRGSIDVTRVTVQSIWKDGFGTAVSTGLVYAVPDGERLSPGEVRSFVDTTKLRGIERCNVRALDWWADD